jgi:hypothetical protein
VPVRGRVRRDHRRAHARRRRQPLRRGARRLKDAADIAGIGDGAFNSDKNNRAFIWKEKVTVMLTMFVGWAAQLQVATDLGKAIVEKL